MLLHTMKTLARKRLAVLGGLGLWVMAALTSFAQAPATDAKPSSLKAAGYSRPGSPEDRDVMGKPFPPETKDPLLGATILFGVFENVGTQGDTFGTGIKDFDLSFHQGKQPSEGYSPILDTKAKYLYLYQIINDRGLDPAEGIAPAADRNLNVADIQGFSIQVPAGAISSYGYFKKSAFTFQVPELNFSGAQVGKDKQEIRLAASANPSFLGSLPNRKYQPNAPIVNLGSLENSLRISDKSNLGLANTEAFKTIGNQNLPASLVETITASTKNESANAPDLAYLVNPSPSQAGVSEAVFRVRFDGARAVKLGQHTLLVGFTSNQAPKPNMAVVEGPEAAKKAEPQFKAEPGKAAPAQVIGPAMEEKKDAVVAEEIRKARPYRMGTTFPSNRSNEELLASKAIAKFQYRIIGGTVYMQVFERPLNGVYDSDPWGTGWNNVINQFVEGYNFEGGYSPRLDTHARYLYLYQVVNDRGLHPNDTEIAVEGKPFRTTDIAAFVQQLSVDPRYITSWGYFRNIGFTVAVPNVRESKDGTIPAGLNLEEKDRIQLAVSSLLPVESEIPNKVFRNRSGFYPLPQSFAGVANSNLNLTKAVGLPGTEGSIVGAAGVLDTKAKDLIALVNFAEDRKAKGELRGGKEPQFVQLLYATAPDERVAQGVNLEEVGISAFRVDWGRNPMLQGEHSVVFGFTTDLPPTRYESIRIENLRAAAQGNAILAAEARAAAANPAIRAAAGDLGIPDGTGTGTGVGASASPEVIAAADGLTLAANGVGRGLGQLMGPATPAAADVGAGAGLAMGGLGGLAPGGGMGGGLAFPGIGGLGGARAPGGGSGGGTGGGTGGGQGNQSGQGQNANQNNQNQNPDFSINFNVTQNNQNQQQQQQQQKQNQGQGQGRKPGGGGHGNVIPEPGSILLGLLGLPGIAYYWRRRQRQNSSPTA